MSTAGTTTYSELTRRAEVAAMQLVGRGVHKLAVLDPDVEGVWPLLAADSMP